MKKANAYIILKQKIEKARQMTMKAQLAEEEVFEILDNVFGSDITDKEYQFVNADNIGEGISCYINYGEGNIDDIIEALVSVTNQEGDNNDS